MRKEIPNRSDLLTAGRRWLVAAGERAACSQAGHSARHSHSTDDRYGRHANSSGCRARCSTARGGCCRSNGADLLRNAGAALL